MGQECRVSLRRAQQGRDTWRFPKTRQRFPASGSAGCRRTADSNRTRSNGSSGSSLLYSKRVEISSELLPALRLVARRSACLQNSLVEDTGHGRVAVVFLNMFARPKGNGLESLWGMHQ